MAGAKNIRQVGNEHTLLVKQSHLLVTIGEVFRVIGILPYKILVFAIVKLSLVKNIRIKRKRIIVFGLMIVSGLIGFWFYAFKDLPSVKDLENRQIDVSTKIYDRNGVLLYTIYKNKNRSIIPLSSVPKNVIYATLAAEDAEFYSHPGFSLKGISRAISQYLTNGKKSGGSTITQQLVKNALLSSERTFRRKLRELILALEVESTYSKDKILEMYLNEISYGGTTYGIGEAAKTYFGKDISNLSLAEAAYLAGLTESPTKLSPFGQEPLLGIERQKRVLSLMAINRYITQEEMVQAEKQRLTFAANRTDILAPHFVMYVREILAENYGEAIVDRGGLNVITTLDYTIQKVAENAVKQELEKLTKFNVTNSGVIVTNPGTGEILAMVGSKDYFDTKAQGNVNVTLSLRPPGSSIKVVNYAYALGHGFTLGSILSDTPVTFSIPGSTPYTPKNYDGKYRGSLTLRSALAESRNIPAVKVLANIGVENMIETGKGMGITTWNQNNIYGLSLTLGGGSTKLTDMATVYGTLANYGYRVNLNPLLSVKDYKGKLLFENRCVSSRSCGQQTIDQKVAYLITDVLKDNNARSPSFGLHSQLVISNHPEVAVKTGTSNDLRDNLAIGYTKDYLAAVWVGNNNNSPMSKVASGVTGATPIWNQLMSQLLTDKESYEWTIPDGIVKTNVCTFTGTLPCEGCLGRTELFIEGTQPKTHCTLPSPTPLQGPSIL